MKQRSDYTFKYNVNLGRHGWLRLTPAYSVKLVENILGEHTLFADTTKKCGLILDPFCGTATTGIVSAEKGYECYLYEINPFLHWFSTVKSAIFSDIELSNFVVEIKERLNSSAFKEFDKIWIPPMKNINRWWSDKTLGCLGKLHQFLKSVYGDPTEDNRVSNLAWIAFSRLIIEISAADYGHISVSFKESCGEYTLEDIIKLFISIIEIVSNTAKRKYTGRATIILGDSRDVHLPRKVNYVITSPPYPNRISYIRELRPYMYWLGFLSTGEEAGNLDWSTIGGTWGSATSKLSNWTNEENWHIPESLKYSIDQISMADAKNGKTMAQYVLKFFYDMYLHLKNLRKNLSYGCELYYIMGNSSFYGNMVHTDVVMCELMKDLGYKSPSSRVIRKRNSKKELYEFMITSKWEE